VKIIATILLTLVAVVMLAYGAFKVHKRAYGFGFQQGHNWTLRQLREYCDNDGQVVLNGQPYQCRPGRGLEL